MEMEYESVRFSNLTSIAGSDGESYITSKNQRHQSSFSLMGLEPRIMKSPASLSLLGIGKNSPKCPWKIHV